MQVDFYHLADIAIERVLPSLAERLLASGERLLVVTEDAGQAARLDADLWSYAPDAFLPHGRAGEDGEADQPVLIASASDAVNGARNLLIADGRWREEALGFDRAFYLFDAATIGGARAAWRALGTRDGIVRRYWKREDGRWREGP